MPDNGAFDDYPLPDVALLRLTADPYDGPLPRIDTGTPGDDLTAYGYTDEYRKGQALGHSGRFQLAGLAEAEAGDTALLFRMKGDRVRGGMSGCPVLDLQTGRVVGMVKRTQSQSQVVGAFFVPMSIILAAVPEADVTRDRPDQVQLARHLWGELFLGAVALLIDSEGVRKSLAQKLKLEHLLVGDSNRQAELLAAELFQLDLEQLADVAKGVFDVFSDYRASRLFDLVATCTDFRGSPWIAADVAGELAAQVGLAATGKGGRGRLLDLKSDVDLRQPYRRRGSTERTWGDPIECGPFSHETDPDSGLPLELERDLRCGVAGRFQNVVRGHGFEEQNLSADKRAAWTVQRSQLVEVLREQSTLVMLPPQTTLSKDLVERLIRDYSLVFLNNSPAGGLSTDVDAASGYQHLDPDVDAKLAKAAFLRFDAAQTALTHVGSQVRLRQAM